MSRRLLAASVFVPLIGLSLVWALATWGGMRGPAGVLGALILLLPATLGVFFAVRVLRGRTARWGGVVKGVLVADIIIALLLAAVLPHIRSAYRAAGERRSAEGLSALKRAVVRETRERGRPPRTLSEMVPGRLPMLPRLHLPGTGHPATREVRFTFSANVADSGKWAYVNKPTDRFYGRVFIDCTHTDSRAMIWSAY